jgi:hypothetical protein
MNIFLVIVGVVAAFLLFVATRPSEFRVQRSTRINAAPDRIFPLISDFHRWTAWSPWEGVDPNLQRTYSGAQSGKGAVYTWKGNAKAGEGRMEITDAMTPKRIDVRLQFIKPFQADHKVDFTLTAALPQGTDVTWTMNGKSPFMLKLFGVFTNMDTMLGKDFEKGLAAMKGAAEG